MESKLDIEEEKSAPTDKLIDETSASESREYQGKVLPFLSQTKQRFLDFITPYVFSRWIATVIFLVLYMIRVIHLKGWYIITYALGIYYLNLFIAFLSPKIDPARDELYENGPELPTKFNEEFRPFMRRLPEFKFWYSATKAVFVATFFTFFEVFNVPVFWPILLMYFLILFCFTMKAQIKHMIKYRYLPWTTGKVTYKGKEDSGKIVTT